jgi:putative lipoic acid-binding regulatory protein
VNDLVNTLGSQKAFVSEDEWRDMDKKVCCIYGSGGWWHCRCQVTDTFCTCRMRMRAAALKLHSPDSFLNAFTHVPLQVNKYPCQRVFNAIGTGGDDFKAQMMQAVESVVGTIHVECVSERPSSGGKYVSVRIGPVWVENADQVRPCRCGVVCVVCCVVSYSILEGAG